MRPEDRRTLLIEGQNLARLRHENVVSVYGADEHEERIGIWMELVEGQTLSDAVAQHGPYSATEAGQIGIELCRALAAVHRKNLVHADIKAQNVKREAGGRIVLMDFSSSRRSDAQGNPDSDPAGTPLYMAPELWENGSPTVESDIYSLGVLLYHLVTGAFPVTATSIELLQRAHRRGERRLLRDERPQLPDSFVRTVEKALSRNPAERFRSAGAFEEALREQQAPAPAPHPPIPIEVRVLATTARLFVVTGGILVILVALGLLTTSAFNVTLGRPAAFTSELGPGAILWGVRVILPPVIYMLLSVIPIGALLLLWQLLKLARPVRNLAARFRHRLAKAGDPDVASTLLFAFGIVALFSVGFAYRDIIAAAKTPIAEVGREATLPLSPDNIDAHIRYGQWLDAIMLVLGYGSYRVLRRSRQAGRSISKPLFGVLAVFLVTVFLWAFPYRILWHNQFEKVSFEGERAYIIGRNGDQLLLHRPDAAPPRNRIVSVNEPELVRLKIQESIFTSPEQK
jgi:hypothetical protein